MLGRKTKKSFDKTIRHRAIVDEDSLSYKRAYTISGYDIAVASEKSKQVLEREKSQEAQKRKHKLFILTIAFIVFAVVCIIISFQYSTSIINVNTSNQTTGQLDKSKYISVANKYFSEHPLERLSFVFNEQNFSNYIMGNIKEVENATINNRSFLSSELGVKIREPVAIWQSNGVNQYIDGSGAVFDINLMTTPGIIIEDDSAVAANAGLPIKFLRFIGQVIAGIQNSGAEQIEKVIIPNQAIRYIEFHLQGRPYSFKAQIDRDVESQVADIINVISYLDTQHLTPSEYVDVRVEGKAYWK